MTKRTHAQLKKEALMHPNVKKEYDALKEEFNLLNEMLKARLAAGKTQDDVANEMKTTTSVIGRLETKKGKLNPTFETLCKYAHAVDCHLDVRFVSHKKKSRKESPRKEKAESHA